MAVANLCGYAFNVGATRLLGPSRYGALGALLGLVLIFNVVALGIQAVVARRLAGEEPGDVPPGIVRGGLALALVVGMAAVAGAPAVTHWLHLASMRPAVLLGLAMIPLTVFGLLQGILQGAHRFAALGGVYVIAALGKVGGGLAGVYFDRTVAGAVLGLCLGSAVAAAACWLWLRPPLSWSGGETLMGETLHATHAFLAFFVLTNVDVLLARHYLDAEPAGLYAAGAVIAKGAFWLPQFVPVLAFPRMADAKRRSSVIRTSFLVVAAAGMAVSLICFVFGGLVVRAVGGPSYAGLAGDAWLFAALGGSFACCQLLLYGRLAGHDRLAALAVWAATAGLAAVVALARHDSLQMVVTTALVSACLLVAAGVAAQLRRDGGASEAPASVPATPVS